MGSALYRLLANRLAEEYRRATAKSLFSNLLDVGGLVQITPERITVTVDKHAHNPYLVDSGLADQPTPMPWLDQRELVLKFA